jgi:hypothetical protein
MTSANGPQPQVRQNYSVPITSPVASGLTNLGTVSVPAIGSNPVRRKIEFINPNALVTVFVCPSNLTATTGGGSIPIVPGGTLIIEGENVNAGWNAIAASGNNNGLTILEYL